METQITLYKDELKQQVFDFTALCFTELGKAFDPAGRHSFYNDIPCSFTAFWCLIADDKVAGTVALKEISPDTAELKAMYLAKERRGRGEGARLLQTAIDYASEAGYRSIVLDSMSQYTAALRLYKKAGFIPIERYNDNIHADVFMKLELKGR